MLPFYVQQLWKVTDKVGLLHFLSKENSVSHQDPEGGELVNTGEQFKGQGVSETNKLYHRD